MRSTAVLNVRSLGAFGYGFAGSVIWAAPVLFLYGLAVGDQLFIAPLVLFTVFWWWLWTWIAARLGFYTAHILPYSIGGSLGFIAVLYYLGVAV